MSEKYFGKFPLITYNNQLVVNITERVVVRDFPANNALLYYPYDLNNYERPDQLADRYLNDEYMDWIVHLSNGILDPYYDWFMPDDVFNEYLLKKYGDIDKITAKIAYYRNNWYDDQLQISVSQFEDLPEIVKYDTLGNQYLGSAKRYYEPELTGRDVTSYRRTRLDETITTNKIVRYAITGDSHFTSNELVSVQLGYANSTTDVFVSTVSGTGQVLTSNSTTVTIQHTSGYVDIVLTGYNFSTTSSCVSGDESSSNCAITSYSSLANNIVAAEAIYWSPVTVYEDEYEKNLKNKTIRLMDPSGAQAVAENASETLSELL